MKGPGGNALNSQKKIWFFHFEVVGGRTFLALRYSRVFSTPSENSLGNIGVNFEQYTEERSDGE